VGARGRSHLRIEAAARAWRIEAAPTGPLARLSFGVLVVAQGLTTLEAAAALGRRNRLTAQPSGNGARPACQGPGG
jgi:hypothetical protein